MNPLGVSRALLIWGGLAVAVTVPIAIAATSPFLAWRDGIYIASGFAGIAALAIMLIQPLLVGGYLPGFAMRRGRSMHRWVGVLLIVLILAHVIGLFITSPPDALDALLLRSPTPFSVWGVVAMWAAFGAAILAALRSRFRISPKVWRLGHTALVIVVAIGSAVHALLVEGAMEPVSKAVLCLFVLIALAKVVADLRAWSLLARRRNAR